MKNEKGHKSLRNKAIKTFKILNVGWCALPVIVFCIILCLYVGGVFSNLINDEESRSVITFHTTQMQLIANLLLIPLSLYVLIKVLRGKKPFNIYLLCIYVTLAIIIVIILHRGEWKWNSFFFWEYKSLLVLFACLTIYESHKIKLARTYFKGSKDSQDDEGENRGLCVRTKNKDFIDVGWGNYTKALKSRMSHTQLDNGESFAIGISGQWGSGKTTFLDTLEKELGNDFIVIRFIPWYSCTPTTLVKDFFDCVSSELGSMHIDIDFSKYIELLQEIDSTGVLKIINQLIPYNDNDSIENVKRDIEEKLSLIEKKVVIIIDDTDRLRSDELMEMLKIIRLTANFNNVVFVVSYDKGYILEKINEAGIDNNSEYLKKIFPLEITLPLVERNDRVKMFIYEINNSSLDKTFTTEIQKQLKNKLGKILFQKYIKNFRDIKNFTNTMIISHDLLEQSDIKGEISFRDFFWIEVIRTYFPKLYDILSNEYNRDILLSYNKEYSTRGGMFFYEAPREIKGAENANINPKKELLEDLKNQYGDEIVDILQFMFRKGNTDKNSIKWQNNYYKYFSYRLPQYVISDLEFSNLLMMNEEEVKRIIDKYKKENKTQSLYFHLRNFKLKECKDVLKVKNFYIAVFEVCDEGDISDLTMLLKNCLNSVSFVPIDGEGFTKDIINLLKQKLHDGNCNLIMWNKLLASIYPKTRNSNGYKKDVYKSILSGKEIEDLACLNCTNYLKSLNPSIYDIVEEYTDLNEFVKDACVIYHHDLDNNKEVRKSLIFNSLLAYFSLHKEKNNKGEFINTIHYILDIIPSIETILFGDMQKYYEFIEKCFVSE